MHQSELPQELNWSKWFPLLNAGRNRSFPREPGIYRIKRVSGESLDYVGQTGTLRPRLGMLSGVYKPVMPYNDPHTAGPAFWALRQLENCEYEASTAVISSQPTPLRKGMECVVIAQHRQEFGKSPTFNFGRMPLGYSKSTGNTRKLVEKGKRHRGTTTGEKLACHLMGVGPTGSLEEGSVVEGLMGLDWSSWQPVLEGLDSLRGDEIGLYLLRNNNSNKLLYVGEGRIMARVNTHIQKGNKGGHPQAFAFKDPLAIQMSFIRRDAMPKHQFLEIENDIIAAHILQTGDNPYAQFLG
jgi:hypothetical protein